MPAIVAEILHDPVPDVMLTTPELFTVHAVLAPWLHVTEPPVVPPDVVSEMLPRYVPLEVPTTESADCEAMVAASVTLPDDT